MRGSFQIFQSTSIFGSLFFFGILVDSSFGQNHSSLGRLDPPPYLSLRNHYYQGLHMKVDPGYLPFNRLQTYEPLQKCLSQSVLKIYQEKPGNDLGLALVDLSGEKIKSPQFAHYQSSIMMYGASQSKVGVLIAAHQLRYDIKRLGQTVGNHLGRMKRKAAIFFAPELSQYTLDDKLSFSLAKGDGLTVDFTDEFRDELVQMVRFSNNKIAAKVIQKLGFNYINSTLWQLGAYDPEYDGGLWVGKAYGGGEHWHRDPLSHQSHGISAFSLARIFTLLAQKRLINQQASESMLAMLSDTKFRIKFVRGLMRIGLKINGENSIGSPHGAIVYRKSGTYRSTPSYHHDAILVQRSVCEEKKCTETKDIQYVATGALRGKNYLSPLIQEMDRCIVMNNQGKAEEPIAR